MTHDNVLRQTADHLFHLFQLFVEIFRLGDFQQDVAVFASNTAITFFHFFAIIGQFVQWDQVSDVSEGPNTRWLMKMHAFSMRCRFKCYFEHLFDIDTNLPLLNKMSTQFASQSWNNYK